MRKISVIFTMSIFLCSMIVTAAIQVEKESQGSRDESEWSMFRHNPQHTGYIETIAPNTNNTKWIYATEGAIRSSPAVGNGRLYVSSYDWNLYCLDADTGEKLWRYGLHNEYLRASPAVDNERVYVGGYFDDFYGLSACLYCLNALNGSLQWKHSYKTDYDIWGSPTVYDGKVYMGFIGDYDWGMGCGRICCVDAETGDLLWNYPVEDGIVESTPAVGDDRVYIGIVDHTGNGKVLCLDAYNGSLLWVYPTNGAVRASPTYAYGNIYVGAYKWEYYYGIFYCLDADDGEFQWSYEPGDCITSSAAVYNNTVCFGSDDATVYCLDAESGEIIWTYQTDGSIDSSPAIADEKLYIGSWDGSLYCLNVDTGSFLWKYSPVSYPAPPIRSSPTIVDGCVYIGSYYGTITALEDTLHTGEIKGGLGLSTEVTNTGEKTILSTQWTCTVNGHGLLRPINISKQGVLPPLESGSSTMIKIPVFGFGRIQMTFTAHPRGVSGLSQTVDGLLLGCFVIVLEGER